MKDMEYLRSNSHAEKLQLEGFMVPDRVNYLKLFFLDSNILSQY
jgi:hypothetical protein